MSRLKSDGRLETPQEELNRKNRDAARSSGGSTQKGGGGSSSGGGGGSHSSSSYGDDRSSDRSSSSGPSYRGTDTASRAERGDQLGAGLKADKFDKASLEREAFQRNGGQSGDSGEGGKGNKFERPLANGRSKAGENSGGRSRQHVESGKKNKVEKAAAPAKAADRPDLTRTNGGQRTSDQVSQGTKQEHPRSDVRAQPPEGRTSDALAPKPRPGKSGEVTRSNDSERSQLSGRTQTQQRGTGEGRRQPEAVSKTREDRASAQAKADRTQRTVGGDRARTPRTTSGASAAEPNERTSNKTITENKVRGDKARDALADQIRSKGLQVDTERALGRRKRGDVAPVQRPELTTRSDGAIRSIGKVIEVKSKDLNAYRDPKTNQLDMRKLESVLKREIVERMIPHAQVLQEGIKPDLPRTGVLKDGRPKHPESVTVILDNVKTKPAKAGEASEAQQVLSLLRNNVLESPELKSLNIKGGVLVHENGQLKTASGEMLGGSSAHVTADKGHPAPSLRTATPDVHTANSSMAEKGRPTDSPAAQRSKSEAGKAGQSETAPNKADPPNEVKQAAHGESGRTPEQPRDVTAKESRKAAVEGGALILHEKQIASLEQAERTKAERAVNELMPEVRRLQTEGKWVAIHAGISEPKVHDFGNSLIKSQDQVKKFEGAHIVSGSSRDEVVNSRELALRAPSPAPDKAAMKDTLERMEKRKFSDVVVEVYEPRPQARTAEGSRSDQPPRNVVDVKTLKQFIDAYDTARGKAAGASADTRAIQMYEAIQHGSHEFGRSTLRVGDTELRMTDSIRPEVEGPLRALAQAAIAERIEVLRHGIDTLRPQVENRAGDRGPLSGHELDNARSHLAAAENYARDKRFGLAAKSLGSGYWELSGVREQIYFSDHGHPPPQ